MTRPLLVVLVGLLAVALAGCNATKRELTVVFAAGTTTAQHESALKACTGAAPHTTPEPRPTSTRATGSDVRFRIDSANDRDISRLEACLARQPGVQGFQDSADST